MLFISTGIVYDMLRPQIVSVGTTANAALIGKNKVLRYDYADLLCYYMNRFIS